MLLVFVLAAGAGVLIMRTPCTQAFYNTPMSANPPNTETTFEQAMERLEEIVSEMEGDRMPLDEMVQSYEEGMKLLMVCRQRIENARRRVEQISVMAEGRAELTPFEPTEAAAALSSAEERPAPASKPAAPVRRRPIPTKPAAEPEGDDGGDIRLF